VKNQKLERVFFQVNVTIPGIMVLTDRVTPEFQKSVKAEAVEAGVLLMVEGTQAIVPWANVKIAVFAKNEKNS
jgi:hypothetical protein